MKEKPGDFAIGKKIKLGKDIRIRDRTFKKGHIFTIFNESFRGLDIVDNEDNRIYECRFIQQYFIPYNIKEERKEKIEKLNDEKN